MDTYIEHNVDEPWKHYNTLSGRIQTQKAAYYMTPFTWNIQKRLIHKDKSKRSVVARGQGEQALLLVW